MMITANHKSFQQDSYNREMPTNDVGYKTINTRENYNNSNSYSYLGNAAQTNSSTSNVV